MDKLDKTRDIVTSKDVQQTFELALHNPSKMDLAMMNLSYALTNVYGVEDLNPVSLANAVVQMTNLNFAAATKETYIIPYGSKATFQIGYKGWIQLAQRSNQVKNINAAPVYKGEYIGENRLTGELKFNWKNERGSDEDIVGYVGYIKTIGGFEKTIYWTVEQMHLHFSTFSKNNYDSNTRQWMESKKKGIISKTITVKKKSLITVLKDVITKWSPKDATIQLAMQTDGLTFDKNISSRIGTNLLGIKAEVKRIPAASEDIKSVLNQIGKTYKKVNAKADSTEIYKQLINPLGIRAGLDYSTTNGWLGVTRDELKRVCALAEKELNIVILVNEVRLSQQKAEALIDQEIDIK